MVIAIVKVTRSVGQVDEGNCHSRTWYIASKYRAAMLLLCEGYHVWIEAVIPTSLVGSALCGL